MNILLITTTYPTPERPQQGVFNQCLVSALGLRHNVRVIAPIPWTQFPRHKPDSSATSDAVLHPIFFYPPRVLRRRYDDFYWRSIRRTIERLEHGFSPDLVVGYWLHPDGAAALRAANYFAVPSVVLSGGSDLRLLTREPSRRIAIKKVLQQADRVVVVSGELARRAIELGTDAQKIDVIYRGVNRQCFHPINRMDARHASRLPHDAVVVFWAGRLEAVKNPALLLYAATDWKRRWGNRLRVVMAGQGSMSRRLLGLRKRLGLEQVVRFEGSLAQEDLALRYNAADVTVLTSDSEGVPNVLLESIACDVPFVATDVGGVSEVATPGVDRLVAAGDVAALVNAVIWRVNTPSGGKRLFIPSDISDTADRFEAVFRQLVQTPSSPPGRPLPLMPTYPHGVQEAAG